MKMNNKEKATDFLADFTDGVVKYRIKICGKLAVPNIIQIAKLMNFQAAAPPSGIRA